MEEMDLSSILTKEESKEIAETIFNKLMFIYTSIMDYYNELNIALKEYDMYVNSTLDNFLPIEKKIEYIEQNLRELTSIERDIFCENTMFLKCFKNYIAKLCGIKSYKELKNLSFFEVFNKRKYEHIKEDYILIRMIRSCYYYERFEKRKFEIIDDVEATLEEGLHVETVDEDGVLETLEPDYIDIVSINTIRSLGVLYKETDAYYKYKTLLSFVNPYIENCYLTNNFNEDPEFIGGKLSEISTRRTQSNIVDSLYTIQKNRIINLNKNSADLINKTYTFKQLLEIIFKFDKKSDKYETRRKKYMNYHLDCLSEIELSHSFIFANYLMLDEQPIKDLDYLFNILDGSDLLKRGDIILDKKVVDLFFTPLAELDKADDDSSLGDNVNTRTK